jgi:endonuclease/exonuclease/phosphatase family metal-dependent hydrolase
VYGRAAVRVLTWNLFHGRTVPPCGRSQLPAFAAALAGWAWDVALLQEVPPWWPAPLAQACGAASARVLTSRNSLLPLRRAVAERNPDLLGASGGGCNAILVRSGAVLEHRTLRLARRPEARWAHAVRLASGVVVVNLHATVRNQPRALAECRRAAAWARSTPLVLGGDLNLRKVELPGLRHVAGNFVDHLLVAGLESAGSAVLERGALSDHAPVVAELAA